MTPKKLTPDELKEILERVMRTTPGPWVRNPYFVAGREVGCEIVGNIANGYNTPVCKMAVGFVTYEGDKAFIAHSRTDTTQLLAHISALEEEIRLSKLLTLKSEFKDVVMPEDADL